MDGYDCLWKISMEDRKGKKENRKRRKEDGKIKREEKIEALLSCVAKNARS